MEGNNVVIFVNKGNIKVIKNCRPMSLLSSIYKVFIKIITTRLEKKLDENPPRQQGGFRSKYSTTNNIHAITQREVPWIQNTTRTVLDYEKAFDTNTNTIDIIARKWIEDVYIEILNDVIRTARWQHIYTNRVSKSGSREEHLTKAVHGNTGEHI